MKTNAARILEALSVPHSLIEYQFSEDEIDAVSVAHKIGVEPERVFKTLVARNEGNRFFVFVVSGNLELSLKKAARASGSKKIEMIRVKEILNATGYLRGGCSPIGMKKSYPTFIDETAQLFDQIYVSAGIRGAQILISPGDLAGVVEAQFADLID